MFWLLGAIKSCGLAEKQFLCVLCFAIFLSFSKICGDPEAGLPPYRSGSPTCLACLWALESSVSADGQLWIKLHHRQSSPCGMLPPSACGKGMHPSFWKKNLTFSWGAKCSLCVSQHSVKSWEQNVQSESVCILSSAKLIPEFLCELFILSYHSAVLCIVCSVPPYITRVVPYHTHYQKQWLKSAMHISDKASSCVCNSVLSSGVFRTDCCCPEMRTFKTIYCIVYCGSMKNKLALFEALK